MSVSADAEAATQQLLAESSASAIRPASPAVVIGANILNAARFHPPRTNSAIRPSKPGLGKLKRPNTAYREHLSQTRAPRRDIYEIVPSPDKNASSPFAAASLGQIASSDAVHDTPTTPTKTDGRRQCAALCYRNDKKDGPRHVQCRKPGTVTVDGELRCTIHAKRAPTVRCGYTATEESPDAQCPKPASLLTIEGARCAEHAEPPRSTHATNPSLQEQMSDMQAVGQEDEVQMINSSPQPLPRKRKRVATTATTDDTMIQDDDNHVESSQVMARQNTVGVANVKKPMQKRRSSGKSTASQRTNLGRETRSGAKASRGGRRSLEEERDLCEQDTTYQPLDEDDSETGNPSHTAAHIPGSRQPISTEESDEIRRVFQFVDSGSSSGTCDTKVGRAIHKTCDEAFALFSSEDPSLESIVPALEAICARLGNVGASVRKKRQYDFKVDAYTHLFHALGSCLQALYSWFSEQDAKGKESMIALRNLSTFTDEILAFKRTIVSWKVSSSGDGVIMDVNRNFIVPLRGVSKLFRKTLALVKIEERCQQEHAELRRQMQENADKEKIRLEENVATRAKWLQWQKLHVSRMQCEPDPFRRKKLAITKMADMVEEDANGMPFERLPVFRPRDLPYSHVDPALSGHKAWVEAEEVALLDGLQEFAGKPHLLYDSGSLAFSSHFSAGPLVFERIFKTLCRPGGILRDHSVASIVAKAAWMRSACLKLHQEKGWPAPAWVEQIQT